MRIDLTFVSSQRAGKKTKLVRQVVREVVGLMPYEKRILDMIKSGGSSAEKRIYKFSKKRVRIRPDQSVSCSHRAAGAELPPESWSV